MPVMVIGADTEVGMAIVDGLMEPDREVRAFVTDIRVAENLRSRGVKTALGDVSDDSHVGAACLQAHTAVMVGEAASDDRERSFATTSDQVLSAWAKAASDGGVRRVLWVGVQVPPANNFDEQAIIRLDRPLSEIVSSVVELDSLESIQGR